MHLRILVCATLTALLPLTMSGPANATGADALWPSRAASAAAGTRFVLAISIDGLNPTALRRLGVARAPHLHRLAAGGSGTLNARTEVERTVTLPNHTGMLTGRRVNRFRGGHGVWVNHDPGSTVQAAAGHPVRSVFDVVHHHGRRTGLFASKAKFALFHRSWARSIDRFTVITDNARLVAAVRRDLTPHPRAFTFLHLSLPDEVGHAQGFMSPAYLQAVHRTDTRIGELMATVNRSRRLRRHLTVVVTADHGGLGAGHSRAGRIANYRVPFLVWGAGVARGKNLYALSRTFRNPGPRRSSYAARPRPIRNGDVANLSTSLLGLPPVPGSEFDADQSLRVR
ncbi:MAG: alkaline phosphatase family protein [Nocardioides sp.]|nr:alkaline phosphatase family protein [Nocardioides sp.]